MTTCERCGVTTEEPSTSFCGSCGAFMGWDANPSPGAPTVAPKTGQNNLAPAAPAPTVVGTAGHTRPGAATATTVDLLESGRRLALEQDRPDLVRRLDGARARLATHTMPVAVIGEFKRGKSTLVNALLRAQICPVDADVVTAVPTLVRYGEVTKVTGYCQPDDPDHPPRQEALEIADLPQVVSEFGDRNGHCRLASVEVQLPHRLLRPGLALLDTPGVGGLDSAHGVVTLSALDLAEGVLFVTDASQELTAPELEFLRTAVQRCQVAACVVTKTDLHPHWRRIVDLNRAHLERAGLDLPVIGVSSFLRLQPSPDVALDEESGFRPLIGFLANNVVATADTRAADAAAVDLRFVAAQLGRQLEAERQLVRRPQEAERVVARLASAQERTARLASATASWQQALSDRVQDLVAAVEHDLRSRIRDLVTSVEEVIDRIDPKDAWPDVEAWLRREAAVAAVNTYDEMRERAELTAAEVAALFDMEAGPSPALGRAAPTDSISGIGLVPLGPPEGGGRLMSLVLAARSGAFVPAVLLAAASHLSVGLAATVVLAPIGLMITAGIGAKVIKDERARQLAHRRQLAKAAARRYLDEVLFTVGKDCQDTLRLTQRQLRDEFQERAAAMHQSSVATLTAAHDLRTLDEAQRARRADDLDRRAGRLRDLHLAISQVGSDVRRGATRRA